MKIRIGSSLIAATSAALAIGIGAFQWNNLSFQKGKWDAGRNIETDKKILYGYGLKPLFNDTTWIMDSLLYHDMGYESRGAGCVIGSSYADYIDGYNSIYGPHLEKNVRPAILKRAKEIVMARPPNWKEMLSADQKKMRGILFE